MAPLSIRCDALVALVAMKITEAPQRGSAKDVRSVSHGARLAGPDGERLTALRAAVDASARVSQLKRTQTLADASPRAHAGRALAAGSSRSGGLPDRLRGGLEAMSGLAMDDVRVHYDSHEPARLAAHAFARGRDIFLAPGQERHLAHEAWHVVQQKQGRVPTTTQLAGIAVNHDDALEREADLMGARAEREAPAATAALPARRDIATAVSQLKTSVVYGNLRNDCGTSMQAYLDHNDISYGSAPKQVPSWWSSMANLSSGIANFMSKYLVQGHLLNDNLGGPGEMKNMTPITKSANTQMLNFYEKILKTEVLTNDNDATYKVTPVYHYSKAPTADELAGSNLGSSDKSLLDSSGYLAGFCDWIYAEYTIHRGSSNDDSKGLWVKNESNEMKGTF